MSIKAGYRRPVADRKRFTIWYSRSASHCIFSKSADFNFYCLTFCIVKCFIYNDCSIQPNHVKKNLVGFSLSNLSGNVRTMN